MEVENCVVLFEETVAQNPPVQVVTQSSTTRHQSLELLSVHKFVGKFHSRVVEEFDSAGALVAVEVAPRPQVEEVAVVTCTKRE